MIQIFFKLRDLQKISKQRKEHYAYLFSIHIFQVFSIIMYSLWSKFTQIKDYENKMPNNLEYEKCMQYVNDYQHLKFNVKSWLMSNSKVPDKSRVQHLLSNLINGGGALTIMGIWQQQKFASFQHLFLPKSLRENLKKHQ